MKLYFSTIEGAMVIIAVANIAMNTAKAEAVILSILWCTALQFIFDGIIAFTINKMPDTLFGVDNPRFNVSKMETKLYKKLRVRLWKDKIWELGGLGGFSKKTLADPNNPIYIEKFIVECNKGVATHRLSYPIGFLAMFTLSGVLVFTVALPVALVNLFLNVLPTIALRYNTPKLKAVLVRLRRKRGEYSNVSDTDNCVTV